MNSRIVIPILVSIACLGAGEGQSGESERPESLGEAPAARPSTRKLIRSGGTILQDGEPIQLVGYSHYAMLGDRGFEWKEFLRTLSEHQINFTRFFVILPWPMPRGPNLLPFARVGDKYDLRRFDDEFFARLRALVHTAGELGIVCQVCLFDRCGLSQDDDRAGSNHPYNARRNINGFLEDGTGGYPVFCVTQGPVAEIHAALIHRVVETLGDEPLVIYEIMNEPYPALGPLEEWHDWAARELRSCLQGKSGSALIAAAGPYSIAALDLFSMHRAGDERAVTATVARAAAIGRPAILSDDGDWDCMFRPEATIAGARRAVRLGQPFEHLEYALALQSEEEGRPVARMEEMPGVSLEKLRVLAEIGVPRIERPLLRGSAVDARGSAPILEAKLVHEEMARQVLAERSEDGGRTWIEAQTITEGGSLRSVPLRGRPGRNLARFVLEDRQGRRLPGPAVPFFLGRSYSARLDGAPLEDGLLRIRPNHADGRQRRAVRGGLPCHEVDRDRGGRYTYFRLEDSELRKGPAGPLTIEVEVFSDSPDQRLFFEYDGPAGPYSGVPPIPLDGNVGWQRVNLEFADAEFRGRQNDGADFRLTTSSVLAIRSVRLTRR